MVPVGAGAEGYDDIVPAMQLVQTDRVEEHEKVLGFPPLAEEHFVPVRGRMAKWKEKKDKVKVKTMAGLSEAEPVLHATLAMRREKKDKEFKVRTEDGLSEAGLVLQATLAAGFGDLIAVGMDGAVTISGIFLAFAEELGIAVADAAQDPGQAKVAERWCRSDDGLLRHVEKSKGSGLPEGAMAKEKVIFVRCRTGRGSRGGGST